jgi:hypothetical protein
MLLKMMHAGIEYGTFASSDPEALQIPSSGSDIVWGGGGGSRESQLALGATLSKAAAQNPNIVVLVGFCPRYKSENVFWEKARECFLIDGQWRPSSPSAHLNEGDGWTDFTSGDFVREGGGIWICRLRPLAHRTGLQARAVAVGNSNLREHKLEELLSDDSLLEAGGAALSLDDLINPLDARF